MTDERDAIEAAHRQVLRAVESELGQPIRSPDNLPIDPDYNELEPGLAEWWRAHAKAPALTLWCGIDDCHNKVGEVRTEGDIAIALMFNTIGETTVVPVAGATEESLGLPAGTVLRDAKTGLSLGEVQQRRLDDFDEKKIRPVGDGRYVTKRYRATPTLMTLDLVCLITCPDATHGTVALPDPGATIADVRRVLADQAARHAKRWHYALFRGN
jgi:hypothetical protein